MVTAYKNKKWNKIMIIYTELIMHMHIEQGQILNVSFDVKYNGKISARLLVRIRVIQNIV